jgi:hypothetical protein
MRDAITFHHLVIGMTLQTDLGVKLPVFFGSCRAKGLDLMKIMAVVAGSGIRITLQNRLAVQGGHVGLGKIMTIAASGDDLCFVPFPGLMDMDIGVTIKTLDVIEHMDTAVMLGRLFFMTACALHSAGHLFAGFMEFQIGNFEMTTGTAVLTMHRIGKFLHADDVVVTLETFLGIYGDTACHSCARRQQQERQHHPKINPYTHNGSSLFYPDDNLTS